MLSSLKHRLLSLSADGSAGDVACSPNGAPRARRVPRRASRFRRRPRNIAAIDFGTKNCSLAYITENDRLELTQGIPKLPLNGMYLRVPTSLLLNAQGEVEAFGHDAWSLYGNLEEEDKKTFHYFEEIKMNLQMDQVCCLVNPTKTFHTVTIILSTEALS